ncbi:stomatin-like protein 1 isoform X2 [Erinaceus europaeus]|uniref:Stomatin-like protein 1 isoform X2 n=1 Tax=Erinaceus europaeus TaxID=9365 RepID=A0ABM3W0Y7_ERIEU|nr:stomatin-like protein 1 isoform X2 [Erinaceus europaeus]
MLARSGYRVLPSGNPDGFPQWSPGALRPQKGCWAPGRVDSGPSAAPQSWPSSLGRAVLGALGLLLLLLTFPVSAWCALKVVPAYERLVVFRLGRLRRPLGPGLVLLLPGLDSFHKVDLRTKAFSVPPCKLACKDRAVVSVGADVQFRIWDPVLSVMAVKDLMSAARLTARNAMARVLLSWSLHEVQGDKPRVGQQLLLEMNEVTLAWGLEVDRVELAVEAVLQPPPRGPGLDSALQLALHLLGGRPLATPAELPLPAPDTAELVSETGDTPSPEPPAEGLLTRLRPVLSETLVSRVGACYQLNVGLPGGTQATYFLDLTTGQGQVGHGPPQAPPDVVLDVTEADLQALLQRELWPLGAYVGGRLRVQGDLAVAMRLEVVLRALG